MAGIVSCSLVHEKATDPTASGHVRANLELAGYLIEAESNLAESCKLTCLMKLDLGGSLMAWIKTKAWRSIAAASDGAAPSCGSAGTRSKMRKAAGARPGCGRQLTE